VSNCGKYDRRLIHFRRHVLHRLDVTDRIRFRLCVQVYKCQHSVAPGYLVDLCRPVSSIDSHQTSPRLRTMEATRGNGYAPVRGTPAMMMMMRHLRSANCGQLQVPRITMSTYGSRAFGHDAGPSTWNLLELRQLSVLPDSYAAIGEIDLKTLFLRCWFWPKARGLTLV